MSNGYRKRVDHYSYLLNEQIGKGFSSVVYRGTNDHTHEEVAIKVINLKHLRDGLARQMLDTEVECLTQFNHPNLLKLYASLNTANNYYIVTEFCEGDLATKLKDKGKLTEEEFLPIFRDVINGYKMLYCYGYIHRDLKPANLLISKGIIKIADFGFVKKTLNGMRTREDYCIGTPLYMSPESLLHNVYTYKSDIWSMGVLFYELLTGRTPWDCKNEKDLKERILAGKIDYSCLNVSQPLKHLISRCLEREEEKRISFGELEKEQWVVSGRPRTPPLKQKEQSLENPQSVSGKEQPTGSLSTLKSCINLGRFIYKILLVLPKANLPHHMYQQIHNELSMNLHYCLNFHKQILQTRANLISSPDWGEFLVSHDWELYSSVVSSYEAKYQRVIENTVPLSFNKDLIWGLIKETLRMIIPLKESVVLLDYLVSYFQQIQLLQRLDLDYQEFSRLSQIDRIMQGEINHDLDPSSLLQSVRWKLYRMGL